MRERIEDWTIDASPLALVIGVMATILIVHVGLCLLIDVPDSNGSYEPLLALASFVYGLFVAFAIESARSGLTRVTELLKSGDADLVALDRLAASFGDDSRAQVLRSIDDHLQDQIDYRLADFDRSSESFLALWDRVASLAPSTTRQEIAYDHMIGVLTAAVERRKQMAALVRQRVSGIEWLTLISLFASLWALMVASAGRPVAVVLLGGLLLASLAGMLAVLHLLDTFRWQEANAIWSPLHQLFVELGLDPYYPGVVIESGRIDPPTGRLRVADYPHAYPNMTGKTVAVIDHLSRRR